MLFIKMSSSMKITDDGLGESCFTLHHLEINDWGLKSGLHFSLTLWLYSILLKLVPCLVLTIFTACLVRAMYQVANDFYNMMFLADLSCFITNNEKKHIIFFVCLL